MTFLQKIVAILNNQQDIPTLNGRQLISSAQGHPIMVGLEQTVLHKIIRLQTMIIHESEEIVPANLDEVKQVHSVTADASQHIGHTMAKTLVVTHDKASRIQMLERLIVEIVHEAVPQECEYTDVSYRVSLELALLRDHSSGWYRGGD